MRTAGRVWGSSRRQAFACVAEDSLNDSVHYAAGNGGYETPASNRAFTP
jgi:hypothetical protein